MPVAHAQPSLAPYERVKVVTDLTVVLRFSHDLVGCGAQQTKQISALPLSHELLLHLEL